MLFLLDFFFTYFSYFYLHIEKKKTSQYFWVTEGKCKLTWSCIPVVMGCIFSPLTVREQTVLELCASVEENMKKPTWLLELKEYSKYKHFMTVIVKNRNVGIDRGCWTLRGRQLELDDLFILCTPTSLNRQDLQLEPIL